MYQCVHQSAPAPALDELFTVRQSHYATRFGEYQLDVIVPKHGYQLYHKLQFACLAAALWNSLVRHVPENVFY